jgi:hypothetical protein
MYSTDVLGVMECEAKDALLQEFMTEQVLATVVAGMALQVLGELGKGPGVQLVGHPLLTGAKLQTC